MANDSLDDTCKLNPSATGFHVCFVEIGTVIFDPDLPDNVLKLPADCLELTGFIPGQKVSRVSSDKKSGLNEHVSLKEFIFPTVAYVQVSEDGIIVGGNADRIRSPYLIFFGASDAPGKSFVTEFPPPPTTADK